MCLLPFLQWKINGKCFLLLFSFFLFSRILINFVDIVYYKKRRWLVSLTPINLSNRIRFELLFKLKDRCEKKKMDLFNVLTCLCNNSPTLTFFNFYCQSKKKDKTKQGKSLWQRVWISASYTYPAQLPNITNKINKTKKKNIYHIRKIIFISLYTMAGAKECYDIETGRLERERKKNQPSVCIFHHVCR